MKFQTMKSDHIHIEANTNGAYIECITDVATGKTDGTITAGSNVIIEGKDIQIVPVGARDIGMGVYFVAADGTETEIKHHLLQNEPTKIIIRPPALKQGHYTLKILTHYGKDAAFVRERRSIIYDKKLVVE
jgi:hypothetical protein